MQIFNFFDSKLNKSSQSGQALVEFGFLTAIFAVTVVVSALALGSRLTGYYQEQAEQLEHMEATVAAYYASPTPGCTVDCEETTPTEEPTDEPTAVPTDEPTAVPTDEPTATPTEVPSSYVRINPGNSDWQFCMVTPSGTYDRGTLHSNPNFTYTGAASDLYIKPIAGGGDAIVNGQPYAIPSGGYYLFEGNLNVDLTSARPGAMGHWTIHIEADDTPENGNGRNRPTSPCE